MQQSFFRNSRTLATAAVLSLSVLSACTSTPNGPKLYDNYVVPTNSLGQPNLSGFWSNASLTPLARPANLGDKATYTEEEVQQIEGLVKLQEAEANQATDPNAGAEFVAESKYDTRAEFSAAGGDVGGYNYFWLDPGNHVMRVGGEARTSILTTANGRFPQRKKDAPISRRRGGDYSNAAYEVRSLGERCIISFGRNAGPPMFANGFYNNNYQIVQSPDHVMILVEMIHEARIVRLNSEHRSDDVRPWFGDSIGHYEGNTLVVETTHIPQRLAFYGSWENLKVTERFTRVSNERLHYAFTVEDSDVWDAPWGGEYEFSMMDEPLYEYACHEGNYALPGILKGILMEADE
ncbi:hypothetical protein NBRC116493_34760 [Aurantivibrio infirmus]